jgi:Domain of unknown function (DUF4294)
MLMGNAVVAQDQPVGGYTILDTLYDDYTTSIWYVSGTDTLVNATMTFIDISAKPKNKHRSKEYSRLQAKVIKVYPYARAAGDVMRMYEQICQTVTDERERARLLDQAEDEMKLQFESDLRNLTVSEGVILIKLIDRQTGNSSFKLVQDLKGKFSAFMWQSVARLFGHNLKSEYDPEGTDVWIENTCLMIEDGTIAVRLRDVDPFGMKKVAYK